MKISISFFAFVIGSLMLLAAIAPALAVSNLSFDPIIRDRPGSNTASLNWSGYAETGAVDSVTSVTGSWTVPAISPTRGTAYVALWAGIDGYSDSTVEQAGVLAVTSGSTVMYSAWYEFYPAASVTISGFTVQKGDTVTVTVSATSANVFTITLVDGTQTYTKSQTVSSAQRSSAEWIVERPSIGQSLTNLANFGTASFSSCSAAGTALSSPIGITMVNRSGKTLAAISSAWSSGSFSVKYYRSS